MKQAKLALNASTLFPFHLSIIEQIEVAAQAGYDGIEIWMKDLEDYLSSGGTIEEMKMIAHDYELAIVNAIAFFKWTDMNEDVRLEGLEQAKREMNLLAELGCPAIAAPPTGDVKNLSLDTIAHHFTELCKIGEEMGVEPYLEFWGHAERLSTLSEAVYVALESGEREAKLLLDPFHMYKGGSSFKNISYLQGKNIGIFHVNDYPETPSREFVTDQDRLLPGEGIAPTKQIVQDLKEIGYDGYFSLEVFPETYPEGKQPLDVAREGLEKMQRLYYFR